MATDKELENEREITRLKNEQRILDAQAKGASQDSIDLSSAYVDSVKEALGINVRRSTFDSNLLKVNKDINRALITSKAEYRSINDLTKDIAKNNDLIAQAQKSSQSILHWKKRRTTKLSNWGGKTIRRTKKDFRLSIKRFRLRNQR